MTKRERARMQKLLAQPDVAARLQKFANEYFAARELAVVNAVKKDCRHYMELHLAFLWGVQSAFEYRDNPPPALARYARTLAAHVRKMRQPKPGQPCWYCAHTSPKRHAPACPFFGVRVGKEHP